MSHPQETILSLEEFASRASSTAFLNNEEAFNERERAVPASAPKAFLCQVCGALVLQFTVVLCIAATFYYLRGWTWLCFLALFVIFEIIIFEEYRTNDGRGPLGKLNRLIGHEFGYQWLKIAVLFEGWMLNFFSRSYGWDEILLALGIVTCIVLLVTLVQRWYIVPGGYNDLQGGMLIFGVVAICVGSDVVNIIYAFLAGTFFVYYMALEIGLTLSWTSIKFFHPIYPQNHVYFFIALDFCTDAVILFVETLFIVHGIGNLWSWSSTLM